MNLYKHQNDIIEIFESKLPSTNLPEYKRQYIVNLLWETIHQANDIRTQDLEKEIEKLKKQ